MGKFMDITGRRFHSLVVLQRVEDYVSPKGYKAPQWLCQCDCGEICIAKANNLRKGATTSCGCYRKEKGKERGKNNITHGKRYTRIYGIWNNMKQRCLNQKDKAYPNYGGRGISICEEWLHDFQSFYNWAIDSGYRDDLSIDRADNCKGYNPENCRWISNKAQANNRRNNHYVTFNGETHTIAEWSEITGISNDAINGRLKRGWAVEKALTTPSQK